MKSVVVQLWQKQAERINYLSVRERGFLFISAMACCFAIVDVLWLTPAQAGLKAVQQRFAAQGAELQRLREEFKAAAMVTDSGKIARDELQVATGQLAALNQQIKAIAPLAEGGPGLEQALVQLLRGRDGLKLLGLNTVKAESSSAANPSATASAPSPNGLTRRGLELRVAGSYAELIRYVKALEAALPTLRWGLMQLKSEKEAPELVLQVFVVGAQQ